MDIRRVSIVHKKKKESVRDKKKDEKEREAYFGNQFRPRCSVLEYRILS